MSKKLVTSYTFTAAAKTVQSADFTSLEKIQLITNVTDGIIIYNFADPAKNGALSGTTLTLDFDTTAMSDPDKLQIFVDDSSVPVQQYAEDTAHLSGNSGTMDLGVRNDAATVLSGTDGDYTPKAVTGEGWQLQAPASVEQANLSAGSLNADLVASTDVSRYKWWSVQILGTWSGTLSFQGSNDNSNWIAIVGHSETTAGSGAAASTTSNNGFSGPVNYRYMRVRMTAYTSGTATGVLELFTSSPGTVNNLVSAAQSGTWNIGTVTPGTAAANLGKAEDAAHASGDTGVFMLGVRNDAQTSLSSTDGDYSAMSTDGPGNSRVVGNVNDAATDAGSPVKVGGKYNTTLPTYTDGQRGDLQIGTRGSLGVTLKVGNSTTDITASADNADGVAASATVNKMSAVTRPTVYNGTSWDRQRGDTNGTYVVGNVAAAATDSGNPVKIGGKYNATLPTYTDGQRGDIQQDVKGSINVVLRAADASNSVGVRTDTADSLATSATAAYLAVQPRNLIFNGSTWDRLRGTTTGLQVIGGLAHDAADTIANAPTKTGGQARTTNPAAVSDADVSQFITDKLGKQVTVQSVRDLKADQATTITSSTAETTIVAAAGAGVFADVYMLTIANTSATATEVTIRDVTAGGTAQSFMVPAGDTRGFALTESAARKQGTANSAWTAQCGTSVASVKIYAAYVKNL